MLGAVEFSTIKPVGRAAKSGSGTKTAETNFNFYIPSKSKLNLVALLWLRTSNGSIHSDVNFILIMV